MKSSTAVIIMLIFLWTVDLIFNIGSNSKIFYFISYDAVPKQLYLIKHPLLLLYNYQAKQFQIFEE